MADIRLIGHADADSFNSYWGLRNNIQVQRYQCIASGALNSIRILEGGGGSFAVKPAIYADSAGAPGALLGSGNASTLSAGTWTSCALITPVNIVLGTYYWLGWKQSASNGYVAGTYSGATLKYKENTYENAFLNPFGTGETDQTVNIGIAGWGAEAAAGNPHYAYVQQQ